MSDTAPTQSSVPRVSFWQQIRDDNEVVIRHAIGMSVAVICIWAFHSLVQATLGEDAQLFDRIPIVYLAHVGDLLAFLRFIWKLAKEIGRA